LPNLVTGYAQNLFYFFRFGFWVHLGFGGFRI
jgi:hypothetical protein